VAGQAQLRASAALPIDAEAEKRQTIEAAFGAVADMSTAEEQQSKVSQKSKSAGPLTMQVPEKELQQFVSALSSSCKAQFSDILAGKSELHTFSGASAGSGETCTKMKGTLCTMNAQVTQKSVQSGRDMKSTTEVSGKSCLPEECMTEGDLKVLANFMKAKAKESMALGVTADVHIDLTVACGLSAKSDSSGSSKEAAAFASDESSSEDGAKAKASDKKETNAEGTVTVASKKTKETSAEGAVAAASKKTTSKEKETDAEVAVAAASAKTSSKEKATPAVAPAKEQKVEAKAVASKEQKVEAKAVATKETPAAAPAKEQKVAAKVAPAKEQKVEAKAAQAKEQKKEEKTLRSLL